MMTQDINPSDFKYCITIVTPTDNRLYALTNDCDVTYGDVITGLLHNANYKIRQGEFKIHRLSHIFLRPINSIIRPKESDIVYDLSKQVEFKNNNAILKIEFDTRAHNHIPFPLKQIAENDNKNDKKNNIHDDHYPYKEKLAKIKSVYDFSCAVPLNIIDLDKKIIKCNVPLDMTILDLTYIISEISYYSYHMQRLVFNGKQLDYKRTLEDYDVVSNSTIHMMLMLRGGMYQESSGRNGSYGSLDCKYFSLDDRDDISKHYIPNVPRLKDSTKPFTYCINQHVYDGFGQEQT